MTDQQTDAQTGRACPTWCAEPAGHDPGTGHRAVFAVAGVRGYLDDNDHGVVLEQDGGGPPTLAVAVEWVDASHLPALLEAVRVAGRLL